MEMGGVTGEIGTGERGGPGTLLTGRPRAPQARTLVTPTDGHRHVTGIAVDRYASPLIGNSL